MSDWLQALSSLSTFQSVARCSPDLTGSSRAVKREVHPAWKVPLAKGSVQPEGEGSP